MCGIGGVVGTRAGLDLVALHDGLLHRGPDGHGAVSPDAAVWLCSTRLALRDLSPHGAQPLGDGAHTLVYNGEIYNTAELARALGDDAPRGTGDTALLLAAYRRWGHAVVERLEGMFAFALWDRAAQHVLLARDPLGIKPLWIARTPSRVVFASEVRPLLRSGAVPARLEPAAVAGFLAAGSSPEPGAIVRGVEALPPGHSETISLAGAARRQRYWSIPRVHADAADAAARIGARLAVAVPETLLADTEVGLMLSEGVDSTALALLASRAGLRPPSFHVKTDAGSAQLVRERARSWGFRHVEIELDPITLGEAASGWMATQDQPSVDGLNTWVVCRAIRAAGVKAALSGLGGDELFIGYRHYRLARGLARGRGVHALLRRPATLLAGLQARAQLSGGLAARLSGGWRAGKALDLLSGTTSVEAALRRLIPGAIAQRLFPAGSDLARPSYPASDRAGATAASMHDLRTYLVDTLLRDADTVGMAHGVELRVPFLDVRLVELVSALPDSVRGGARRLLFAAVPGLAAFAPDEKRGFELPAELLLRGRFADELRDLADDRALVEGCGLAQDPVRSIVEAGARSRRAAFRALALGSLLGWSRRLGASL